MKKIFLDVRQFAVPVPRVGSIETHSGYSAPPLNGQEIHQIFQKRRKKENENYVTEKKLGHLFETGDYHFSVGGRVDGIIESETVIIEELKTAFESDTLYEKLDGNFNHPYILQLLTYGYFYFLEKGISPKLHLTIISSRNFRSKTLEVPLDIDRYECWLDLRLKELIVETKAQEKIFHKRLKTSNELVFPFSTPRKGQRELVCAVEENFKTGIPLLIQAPTGLGKTAGLLYPALQESLSRGQKVVYVTPKNSQHLVAEEAVSMMQSQGAKIKSFTLTAKSKLCLKAEPLCNPVYCEYAKDHYEKVAKFNLVDVIQKKKRLTAKTLKKLGEEFSVCPFELSLEAIEKADVVIADYNYVFSPRSLIGRLAEPLFDKEQTANLIIDEAHNLPSRAQDYFSSSLSLSQLDIYISAKIPHAAEARQLILKYKGPPRKITIEIKDFSELNQKIRDFTLDYLEDDSETIEMGDPVLAFSNLFNDFTSALELSGEEFFHTYQESHRDAWLKVTCCDASLKLAEAYKKFKNVAAFSATVKPFNYYHELLGLNDETKQLEFVSPFAHENRKVIIIPQVSTKLKDRERNSYRICEVITKLVSLKKGNYIVLFPSFEFMNRIARDLDLPDMRILVQQKFMKNKMTADYLEALKENTPTVLLGVQGGVFSEGVDYPGDMLVGAFIVGPALPQFDFEREQIKNYYENRFGAESAFNYTYVYPAMARAIQSAGRVIRTETDRGLIVFLDPRFLEKSYAESMPAGWFKDSPQELLSTQILQDVKNFWELKS